MGYTGDALTLIVMGLMGLFLWAFLASLEIAAWRQQRRREQFRAELAETLSLRGLTEALNDTGVFPRLQGKRHRR